MPATTFQGAFPPPDGYDFGHNGCNGQNGFEFNSKQYTVLMNGSNNLTVKYNYHLFENMTEVDASNAPQASAPDNGTGNQEQAWCVAIDGSTVLLLETTTDGTTGAEGPEQTLNLYTIDVAGSRTWSGPTALSLPVRSQYRGGGTGGAGVKQFCIKLAVRGPGDYILMFSGHPANVSGNLFSRLYYATFNGSTFGTPVMLPIETGLSFTPYYLGAGTISVDSDGRCYFFAEDNNSNDGLGPSLVLWTLTSAYSLSAAQVIDIGIYWSAAQGTISNSIVYTPSGGPETVAIASEFLNDQDYGATSWSQRLYTASVGDTPTFTKSDVITGQDTWEGSGYSAAYNDDMQVPQFSEWNTQTIAIAHDNVAHQLMVVWAVTRYDGPGDNTLGHFWSRTSPDNALSWSDSTLLFDSPPGLHSPSNGADQSAASQIWAYSTSTGMAVIGVSENEAAQFWSVGAAAAMNYASAGGPLAGRGNYASA